MWSGAPAVINYCEEEKEEGEVCDETVRGGVVWGGGPATTEISVSVNYSATGGTSQIQKGEHFELFRILVKRSQISRKRSWIWQILKVN